MYLSMHVCIHTYVHACVQVSEDVKVMVGYREMLSANSPAARPVHGAVGNKLGFGEGMRQLQVGSRNWRI